jgi:hypothetical protein
LATTSHHLSTTQETNQLGAGHSSDKRKPKLSSLSNNNNLQLKDSHASTVDRDSKLNSKKISIRVAHQDAMNLGTPKALQTSEC